MPPAPQPASRIQIKVERHRLDNGLTILIAENHAAPTFCYMTVFRVGSRNEGPGITGISHLFEHMMFNGSAGYAPKQFDRIIESAGGYSNGSTWYDTTCYYEEVSSESLETVLDLEADRMRSLLITPENLEQERSIVKEERRLRTDNSTEGKMFELLMANAYVASPYRWPVVGWEPDLDNIALEDCRRYFRTYYAPNNAIVVVSGDVEAERVISLMQRYFGDIPAQEAPRAVIDPEPDQKGEKRLWHRMPAELPAVMIGYKAVGFRHQDFAVLEVVRSILGDGESSRLYRDLVYEKQIATEVYAFFRPTIHDGPFVIYGQAKDGLATTAIESGIYGVIEGLASGGTTERELQKVRNQMHSGVIREMKNNAGKAERIGFFEAVAGDYEEMSRVVEKIDAVTAQDVARAAREYFGEHRRTVVTLVPDQEESAT